MHLVRLTVLEFIGPRFADHLDQQIDRHESAPQAGADLDPDKGLQVVDQRRQNRKVRYLHPLEKLAMAFAVLVEQAGNHRPEEEEHLVALARRPREVDQVAGQQAIRMALFPRRARLAQKPNLLRGKREHAGRMACRPQRARVGVRMVREVRDNERLACGFWLRGPCRIGFQPVCRNGILTNRFIRPQRRRPVARLLDYIQKRLQARDQARFCTVLVELQDERRSAVEHRPQEHLRKGVRPAAEARDEDREETVVAPAVANGADDHAVQVPGKPIGRRVKFDVLDWQIPHRNRRHAQTPQVA